MEFIEAPAFSRCLTDYLRDEEYRALQSDLASNPLMGNVMPGTGGFRKLRWADARRGKGRRGGLRVIYYFFLSDQQIWLMAIYDKDEASDLTANEKKALRDAVLIELKARETRRALRKPKPRRAR